MLNTQMTHLWNAEFSNNSQRRRKEKIKNYTLKKFIEKEAVRTQFRLKEQENLKTESDQYCQESSNLNEMEDDEETITPLKKVNDMAR
jgi:hypothetical protein